VRRRQVDRAAAQEAVRVTVDGAEPLPVGAVQGGQLATEALLVRRARRSAALDPLQDEVVVADLQHGRHPGAGGAQRPQAGHLEQHLPPGGRVLAEGRGAHPGIVTDPGTRHTGAGDRTPGNNERPRTSPGAWLPVSTQSAPEGIRTPNLLIRSQMLYPLSYGRMLPWATPHHLTGVPGAQRNR